MTTGLFRTSTNYGRRRPLKFKRDVQLRGLAKGAEVRRENLAARYAEVLAEYARGGSRKEMAARMGIPEEKFKKRLAAARKNAAIAKARGAP